MSTLVVRVGRNQRSRTGLIRSAVFVLLAAAQLVAASAIAQDRHYLTLTGASPGGLWSLLGAGINAAVVKQYPGSVVTYQTSGGGLANVVLLDDARADLGIVHNVELRTALLGNPPFRQRYTNLRAIAYLYNWAPMQWTLSRRFSERYGLVTGDDLVAVKPPIRFGVHTRGNMVYELNRQILAAHDVSFDDVEAWGGRIVVVGQNEMADLLQDRRLDMMGNGVFAPYARIVQTGAALDLSMLSLSDEVIEAVSQATGAEAYTIPAGTYEWLDRDINTVALGAALVATDELSERVAYEVARALVENVDQIRRVHTSMHELSPELMGSLQVIPYHPGALRYYREAGLVD